MTSDRDITTWVEDEYEPELETAKDFIAHTDFLGPRERVAYNRAKEMQQIYLQTEEGVIEEIEERIERVGPSVEERITTFMRSVFQVNE